jgi:hypothetical protein
MGAEAGGASAATAQIDEATKVATVTNARMDSVPSDGVEAQPSIFVPPITGANASHIDRDWHI